VNRDRFAWAGVVVALALIGLVIGRLSVGAPEGSEVAQAPAEDGAFRRWFWESRSLDLIAQVGLIFAGALGIAALLPRDREEGAE
jgi:hypothetical protein